MKHNNMEALFYNIQDNSEDSEAVMEKDEAVNQKVEALGLPFREKDAILCAVNEYASANEFQGFSRGFKTAVDLIFSGGGYFSASGDLKAVQGRSGASAGPCYD